MSMQVYYAKFPPSIETRKILLLIPILGEDSNRSLTRLSAITCIPSRSFSLHSSVSHFKKWQYDIIT